MTVNNFLHIILQSPIQKRLHMFWIIDHITHENDLSLTIFRGDICLGLYCTDASGGRNYMPSSILFMIIILPHRIFSNKEMQFNIQFICVTDFNRIQICTCNNQPNSTVRISVGYLTLYNIETNTITSTTTKPQRFSDMKQMGTGIQIFI